MLSCNLLQISIVWGIAWESQWLQVSANVGILAGLILVALQMQQSLNLTRVQLEKQEAEAYIATEMDIAGENFAQVWQKSIEQPEDLTLAEMRVMEAGLWGHGMMRWVNSYRLYELGLLDDEEWRIDVGADVPFALGNSYGRAWWEDLKNKPHIAAYIGQELIDHINSVVESSSPDYVKQNYRRIQQNLKQL